MDGHASWDGGITTEEVYADGDLILVVGAQSTRFRVSKLALCLASPVWKVMLTGKFQACLTVASEALTNVFAGRFAEAQADEVVPPADDPASMRYLLKIAHLRLDCIASNIPLREISGFAKLCDKYDCTVMAADRIRVWMAHHHQKRLVGPDAAADWMWIGWAARNRDWFMKGVVHVLVELPPPAFAFLPELPPGCRGTIHCVIPCVIDYSTDPAPDFLSHHMRKRYDPVLDRLYAFLEATVMNPSKCHANTTLASLNMKCELIRAGLPLRLITRLGGGIPLDRALRPSIFSLTWTLTTFYNATVNIKAEVMNEIGAEGYHLNCREEFNFMGVGAWGLSKCRPYSFPEPIRTQLK